MLQLIERARSHLEHLDDQSQRLRKIHAELQRSMLALCASVASEIRSYQEALEEWLRSGAEGFRLLPELRSLKELSERELSQWEESSRDIPGDPESVDLMERNKDIVRGVLTWAEKLIRRL